MLGSVYSFWGRLRVRDKALCILALLCVLGAVAIRPLALHVNPKLAATAAYVAADYKAARAVDIGGVKSYVPNGTDPWGSPWSLGEFRSPSGSGRTLVSTYSFGPNRDDDAGCRVPRFVIIASHSSADWLSTAA